MQKEKYVTEDCECYTPSIVVNDIVPNNAGNYTNHQSSGWYLQ